MTLTLVSKSREETERMGEALAAFLRPGDVVLLSGDLGAGKTQLSKGVARGLGVCEPVTSPTFNILLVHEGTDMPLFHFDLYRLENESELEDIDYFGTLEDEGVSLVEWGDRFPGATPEDALSITMSITGDDSRSIEVSPSGPRSAHLADSWVAAVGAGR